MAWFISVLYSSNDRPVLMAMGGLAGEERKFENKTNESVHYICAGMAYMKRERAEADGIREADDKERGSKRVSTDNPGCVSKQLGE